MDVLEPETGKVEQYTLADGLAAAGSGVAVRDRDGALWFGAHRGISKFTPQPDKTQPPPIFIGAVRVAGKSVPINAVGEVEVSGLTLAPDERQIEIDYFGLALATGEALRYQYKLEGADTDWSAPVSQRTANYPKIPPGNYRFLIRAINSDGVTSPAPAAVSFTVLRPVWQRWWFLAMLTLLAGFALYALYRYRLAQLLKLERVRTRIATDLHDDIGASLSRMAIPSEVVKTQPEREQAAGMLTEIAESSRGLVDSMSDIVWSIDPRKDDLRNVVLRIRSFASDVLEAQDIAWEFRVPPEVEQLKLAPEVRRHLYLILKEAINNIARHAGCQSVSLNLVVAHGKLTAEIRDDGCGFSMERREDFSANGRGGNGLKNMRARAIELGGQLQINSSPGGGTHLTLTVPL